MISGSVRDSEDGALAGDQEMSLDPTLGFGNSVWSSNSPTLKWS